ncbi:MAG: FAD/NAD(P)-binding protein [Sediminicola sp.]
METADRYTIGIIGMGPKGLYGLERLLAALTSDLVQMAIDVHLFNTTSFFGSGDVYRSDQPSYLLMNYANYNISLWPDSDPEPVGYDRPTFVQWLSKRWNLPESAVAHEYAPRALVGSYLEAGFQALCANLPANVELIPHVGEVVDIILNENGYSLYFSDGKGIKDLGVHFRNLLFSTGHLGNRRSVRVGKEDNKIPYVYPVEEMLCGPGPSDTVAIKGLGLTFLDALLELTQGRGGSFYEDHNGALTYAPSGNEPKKIFAFSRSGLPMIPRTGQRPPDVVLHYFNRENLQDLGAGSEQVDFREQLLPLIKMEMVFAYYDRLLTNYGDELVYHYDFSKVQLQIQAFHMEYPQTVPFCFENLARPIEADEREWESSLLEYIGHILEEAGTGPEKSPLLAAIGVWNGISNLLNECYQNGGLTPNSHRTFDEYYRGFFNRIAHGPPIVNIQKMLALAKAGILDLSFSRSPLLLPLPKNRGFTLTTENGKSSVRCGFLVDARIPKTDIENGPSRLYENMLGRGLIVPFVNGKEETYSPGCPALDPEGHPMDQNGSYRTSSTFYGTPTEGITFDNDTLSRTRNDLVTKWAHGTIEKIKAVKLYKNEV